MEFKFHCPHCGQRLSAAENTAETAAVCPVCKLEFTVPRPARQASPKIQVEKSEAAPPSVSSCSATPSEPTSPNLCPYCCKPIDLFATVCPHCTKSVRMHNLQKREPKAYAAGIIFAIIALPIAYFIHKKTIIDCFTAGSSCPYIYFGGALIFLVYGAVGFWVGFTVFKSFRG